MNLTSEPCIRDIPKVFLDTTVLFGALRTDGINRSLLEIAKGSTFFVPVLSKVCLLEFYRKALDGLGGRVFSPE